MSYLRYKEKVECVCPVAVKLGQHEVHAPDHAHWGVVTCGCGDKFAIGPHRIYGARLTDSECATRFEALLEEDHKQKRVHQNSYEIPD
jgi:hypothetical protein